jgi:outer membrane immunogenic protein
MRRLALALCATCVITAAATEEARSDGPYGYPSPTVITAPGWTGLYLGAHLGGAWGSSTATDSSSATTLTDYWSAAPSGFVAGVQLGYNWQFGPMVYGLEGDLGNLGLAGSATTTYVPYGYDTSTNTDAGFYLTLRGRLGFLVNGWLLYATGGYIGADTTVSVLEACNSLICSATASASAESFRSGWTIGGGVEAGISDGWTAKLEYLYYDLGSETAYTNASLSGGPNSWTINTDGSLVRVGVNYRFNTFQIGQ